MHLDLILWNAFFYQELQDLRSMISLQLDNRSHRFVVDYCSVACELLQHEISLFS
jgi:hypothetical protein